MNKYELNDNILHMLLMLGATCFLERRSLIAKFPDSILLRVEPEKLYAEVPIAYREIFQGVFELMNYNEDIDKPDFSVIGTFFTVEIPCEEYASSLLGATQLVINLLSKTKKILTDFMESIADRSTDFETTLLLTSLCEGKEAVKAMLEKAITFRKGIESDELVKRRKCDNKRQPTPVNGKKTKLRSENEDDSMPAKKEASGSAAEDNTSIACKDKEIDKDTSEETLFAIIEEDDDE